MLVTQITDSFKNRRRKLYKSPRLTERPTAVLIPGNALFERNQDVHYPFRQDTNFYYLTGFEEPESCLLLLPPTGAQAEPRMVLFVQRRDVEREIWEGERYGIERARTAFGAQDSFWIDEFSTKAPELLKGVEVLLYRQGHHPSWDRRVFQVLEQVRLASGRSGKGLVDLIDPRPILGELRLRKDAEEVAYLRKASDLSKAAHLAAMQEARPGMMEYEIEARLDFEMRKRGSPRVGYPAIVAGGKNATCLHYRANNEPLRDGELLLIDAGGEFGYYTADITRTFPIGRNFTNEQALVYEWVLKAQKAALALCRPGETLPKIHETAIRTLIQGMLSLGWLKGDEESLYRSQAFKQFYPHGTGHFLGSEVHDAGLYLIDGKPRPLEAGMCFTVEPGLYVQPNDTSVPEKWRGIGIRIEDDLIITASAHENLTEGLPKEREEVEALRGKAIG